MNTRPEGTPAPHGDAARNGAAFRPDDPASLFGGVFANRLGQVLNPLFSQLPQMLASAVGQAYAQVVAQVRPRRPMCATCLLRRALWDAAHAGDMEAARLAAEAALVVAMAENGITERDDPRLPPIDIAAYLPEHLRPLPDRPWGDQHMPAILDSACSAGGTDVCPFDIPGAPQPDGMAPPQQRPLLLVPAMSISAAARLAGQHVPGMPGSPG